MARALKPPLDSAVRSWIGAIVAVIIVAGLTNCMPKSVTHAVRRKAIRSSTRRTPRPADHEDDGLLLWLLILLGTN